MTDRMVMRSNLTMSYYASAQGNFWGFSLLDELLQAVNLLLRKNKVKLANSKAARDKI